ncbi:hypothetical protein WUBG_01311 [Wuchereria bancrofti]|uniref:Uncharacterized protein n=1 Tax=Wuchereria bancrofti TaxID=6293 RepID=J9BK07_WUCBA|nr:hypothetical protein WUBG_01311 [Wuchereria bancrofti]
MRMISVDEWMDGRTCMGGQMYGGIGLPRYHWMEFPSETRGEKLKKKLYQQLCWMELYSTEKETGNGCVSTTGGKRLGKVNDRWVREFSAEFLCWISASQEKSINSGITPTE